MKYSQQLIIFTGIYIPLSLVALFTRWAFLFHLRASACATVSAGSRIRDLSSNSDLVYCADIRTITLRKVMNTVF